LRMFITTRDSYFNPLFGGIHRATDPVMKPIHRALRKGPVDTSKVDFLVLIPIVFLLLFMSVVRAVLNPNLPLSISLIVTVMSFVDAAFLVYVVLILIFSVFYKYARFPSNPFVRAGFKIMEPVYSFIGKYAPPLKNWPGPSAFILGFLLHWAVSAMGYSLLYTMKLPLGGSVEVTPGLIAFFALGISLGNLLRLATFFMWVVIIGALMSWINPDPNNPIVQLIRLMSEPINRPFRKIVPNIGGIDISPIFSILVLQLVARTGSRLLGEIMLQIPKM